MTKKKVPACAETFFLVTLPLSVYKVIAVEVMRWSVALKPAHRVCASIPFGDNQTESRELSLSSKIALRTLAVGNFKLVS